MCSFSRVRLFMLAGSSVLIWLLLSNPEAAAEGFAQGVHLCLRTLLPALFPFFVLCSFVASLSSHKSSFFTALLLSWLGGYAVCAGFVRDLSVQGKTDLRRAQLLLLLGCCSGPGFVIGSVGGQLMGSVRIGVVLYIAQLAANLAAVLIMWPFTRHMICVKPQKSLCTHPEEKSMTFSDAIIGAVDTSMCVCGTVLFFRVIQAVLLQTVNWPSWLSPVVSGILEISAGCAEYAQTGGPLALHGICFCLSFLGLSVFLQLHAIIGNMVELRPLLLERLLHIPLMWLFTQGGLHLLPGESEAFSSMSPRIVAMNRAAPDASFVVFLFFCAVLYKIHKKNYNKIGHA